MNIVFMGTPDFAVPSLEKLIEKFGVKAVFTQPDRPKGRGNKITMSPVKETASKYNIPVYQPVRIKKEPEAIETIKSYNPDFIIVVAFGQILPKEVIEIPKYGCINLHASLLPKYRGAAPINWAIINGEKKTGNTTMLMDVGLDTGDMLLKQEVEIAETMTAGELHDILMEKGSELLLETVDKFSKNQIVPQVQNNDDTCYASTLNKETGKIDWTKSGKTIVDLIRGLNPWPIAYTKYNDNIMKIYNAKFIDEKVKSEAGTIVNVDNSGIKISCDDGYILVEKIQFSGKKPMFVKEYIKGNSIEEGTILK